MERALVILGLLIPSTYSDISVCKDEDAGLRDCHMNALLNNKCHKYANLDMLKAKSLYKLRKACEDCPCCLQSSTECVELRYEDPKKHICPGYLKYYKDYTKTDQVTRDLSPPADITRLTTTKVPIPVPSTIKITQPPPTCPPCTCPVCPTAQTKDIGVDTGDLYIKHHPPQTNVGTGKESHPPQSHPSGTGSEIVSESHDQFGKGSSHVGSVEVSKVVVKVGHKGTHKHEVNFGSQYSLPSTEGDYDLNNSPLHEYNVDDGVGGSGSEQWFSPDGDTNDVGQYKGQVSNDQI